jgi:hypothetical protein
MLRFDSKLSRVAGLALSALLTLPLPVKAGGWFSRFCGKCDSCGACATCEPKCEKARKPPKHQDPPMAPVVQSMPAVMVQQIATPVSASHLEAMLLETQDLTELRAKLRRAQRSCEQPAALTQDAARTVELEKQLSDLTKQIDELEKLVRELATNPDLLRK